MGNGWAYGLQHKFHCTRLRQLAALLFSVVCFVGPAFAQPQCEEEGEFFELNALVRDVERAYRELDVSKVPNETHPLLFRTWNNNWGLLDDDKSCRQTATILPFNEAVKTPFYNPDGTDDRQIVVIGDIHDNPHHQQLRSIPFLYYKLAAKKNAGLAAKASALSLVRRPAVFEFFAADQQAALDGFQQVPEDDRNLDRLKKDTRWDTSGWSKLPYDVLLESAVKSGVPIYAGDVPRDAMMKVAKEGPSAIPEDDRKRLKLDVPLGEKLDAASIDEIYDAHCQSMPKEALGGLAFAQRYRDANLADVALKAAEKHGSAIVLAGNGHVRTDRGVPWYIKQRAPDKKVVSVMLIEVEDGKNDPETYVPRDPDGKPVTDYIIFTPKAARSGDPCDKFKPK